MRTLRCSARLGEGVCLPKGCLPGGCTPPPLLTESLTHACESITFPKLLLRTLKILGKKVTLNQKQKNVFTLMYQQKKILHML